MLSRRGVDRFEERLNPLHHLFDANYQELTKNCVAVSPTRYQASHESQLNALNTARNNKQGGHPFWWAGFIYFGDPGDR